MQKISEVKYEGPKKTIQSKFTEEKIKDKLKGYTQVIPSKLKDIKPGSKYVYELPIKGDMLKNLTLKVHLPKLHNGQKYVHNVGTKLIKNIKLLINEQLINEYDGLTMFVFSRLMNNASKVEAFDRMTAFRSSTSYYSLSNESADLYIPLILWESYGMENYIPFCSIYNSKIKIEIHIATLDELYVSMPSQNKYHIQPIFRLQKNKIKLDLNIQTLPSVTSNLSVFVVDAISDQILLNKNEQTLLQKTPQEYVFPQLLHQTEKLNSNINKIHLQFNIPVKQIVWVITDHEEIETYDFKSFTNAQFILGSNMGAGNNSLFYSADYYKYCQSYYHNESISEYNIYSYSFALRPYYGHPSGSVDFSKLNTKVLEIHGALKNKFIHIFANGVNVLETNNGNSNVKLKLK